MAEHDDVRRKSEYALSALRDAAAQQFSKKAALNAQIEAAASECAELEAEASVVAQQERDARFELAAARKNLTLVEDQLEKALAEGEQHSIAATAIHAKLDTARQERMRLGVLIQDAESDVKALVSASTARIGAQETATEQMQRERHDLADESTADRLRLEAKGRELGAKLDDLRELYVSTQTSLEATERDIRAGADALRRHLQELGISETEGEPGALVSRLSDGLALKRRSLIDAIETLEQHVCRMERP